MKVAHQGVPVASLPGLAGRAGVRLGAPASACSDAAGADRRPNRRQCPGVRPQPIEPGIDGWFLDRLFGGR